MRSAICFLLLACSCLFSFGQDSPQYRKCGETANSQDEMHRCASEEAGRVDKALNDAYQRLLKLVSKDANASAKIKTAERAWVSYRDAYIDATYPDKDKRAYGSIYPMEVNLLRAQLTAEHTKAILALSKQFQED
jgi:uncharacterized protein YecT (DUF1311 family)